MIMKKMIFSVATILFLGITTTICAQEPVKKDTTKTEPAKNFALMDEPVKKDTAKTEPAKNFALMDEPVKKDTTKTEPAKKFALMDEPVKKDSTKTENPSPAPKSVSIA